MGLPVTITTTGSTFSPKVTLTSGSTATVTWNCPSASITTTGTNPTLSFGSSATRTVYMTVADSNGYEAIDQVAVFNLGFDHTNDPGNYSLSSSYDYTAQSVSGITGIHYMTGLQIFAAANIPGLTGPLDFTGLDQLTNIELYGSSATSVHLSGCEALVRLCAESNNLTQLNLNPVAGNLREARVAYQFGGALEILPLAVDRFPVLYHLCPRDQQVTGMPDLATDLPAAQEIWIYNTRQSGTLAPVSKKLTSVRAQSNDYTSADFTNQFTTGGDLELGANLLTAVTLTGCSGLGSGTNGLIDLRDNAFSSATIDSILSAVDGWGTSNGVLHLDGNPAPGSSGNTSKSNLQGRGWTVTTGPGGISVVQTASGSGTSLSFSGNVTAGNTVILVVGAYTSSSGSISSSSVTLNSATVTGTTALFNPSGSHGINSGFDGSGNGAYIAAWMLPNVPGGVNGLAVTVSNAGTPVRLVAYEVNGLGSTPSLDVYCSNSATSGAAVDSGWPGAGGGNGETSGSADFILGIAQVYAGASSGAPAPWTNTSPGSPTWAGYRMSTASSEAFHWFQTASAADKPWAAGVAAIKS